MLVGLDYVCVYLDYSAGVDAYVKEDSQWKYANS